MVAQVGLLAFGPVGWVACAAVTVMLFAGASGVIEDTDLNIDLGIDLGFNHESEVHEEDYNKEGIYVPVYDPKDHERYVPAEPVITPEVDIDPQEQWQKEKERVASLLPYSYVLVYMTLPVEEEPDPDPDFEDMRPPSSSFVIGAEAYDSGIGMLLAAIMAFAFTFWLTIELVEARRNAVG